MKSELENLSRVIVLGGVVLIRVLFTLRTSSFLR